MHRRPALLAAAVAVATIGSIFALPSSARLVAAEPLGGTTVMQASTSGTAEVVLYDDVTLSPLEWNNPDVKLTGKGRVLGVELSRSDGAGDALYVMRLPAFAGSRLQVLGSLTPKPTCTNSPNDTVPLRSDCTYPRPTAITLHEGYYHLAVLTDGSPVRVTLHLHGQQRRHAALHLQRSFRSLETAITPRESLGSSTISFGSEMTPSKGMTYAATVVAIRAHKRPLLRGTTGCERNDTGAAPPYAYSPACPNGTTFGYVMQVSPPANPTGVQQLDEQGVLLYGGNPTGANALTGIGGSFVDSDGPAFVGGVAIWMTGEQMALWTDLN